MFSKLVYKMVIQELKFLSTSLANFHKPNITQIYKLVKKFTVITIGLLLELLMLETV